MFLDDGKGAMITVEQGLQQLSLALSRPDLSDNRTRLLRSALATFPVLAKTERGRTIAPLWELNAHYGLQQQY